MRIYEPLALTADRTQQQATFAAAYAEGSSPLAHDGLRWCRAKASTAFPIATRQRRLSRARQAAHEHVTAEPMASALTSSRQSERSLGTDLEY